MNADKTLIQRKKQIYTGNKDINVLLLFLYNAQNREQRKNGYATGDSDATGHQRNPYP